MQHSSLFIPLQPNLDMICTFLNTRSHSAKRFEQFSSTLTCKYGHACTCTPCMCTCTVCEKRIPPRFLPFSILPSSFPSPFLLPFSYLPPMYLPPMYLPPTFLPLSSFPPPSLPSPQVSSKSFAVHPPSLEQRKLFFFPVLLTRPTQPPPPKPRPCSGKITDKIPF